MRSDCFELGVRVPKDLTALGASITILTESQRSLIAAGGTFRRHWVHQAFASSFEFLMVTAV
jgi:hypothetical protein